MDKILPWALLLIHPTLVFSQEEPVSSRIVNWSEADQVAWINTYIAEDMPPGEALTMFVLNRSSVALPVLEGWIERILRSPSPIELFSNSKADPQRVVGRAAAMIAYAGDEQALRSASKLMKVDDQRFGDLVFLTLINAATLRNPFTVAYQGLAMGDPAIDKGVFFWAKKQFADKKEYHRRDMLQKWAEAMVDKYDGVPTALQWVYDPFVARLDIANEPQAHQDILRFAV